MRTSTGLLLKIALLLALANTGHVEAAEITVDDGSQNFRQIAANVPGDGAVWNSLAQSFTATDPFVRFGFRLFESPLPIAGTSVVYNLYQGENIYTTLLATRMVTMPSSVSSDPRSIWGDVGFVEADFSSVSLTIGSRYTVEVTLPVGNLPAAGSYSDIGVWTSVLNPYAGGRFFFTSNFDNSFFADQDMLFHMQPVDVQISDDLISTIAGNGVAGFGGDGGPAASASLHQPSGVAVDAIGNVFVADVVNNRIRKITPGGQISTVAGNGTEGFSGDGNLAINAQLATPYDIAIDATGNLFIADANNRRVRKVTASGIISTVAGNGTAGANGDGGLATSASIAAPLAVAVDSSGNLFIADTSSGQVRKVSVNGTISTVAGNGTCCTSGDGGAALNASLGTPQGVAVDGVGNIYISQPNYHRIRKVTPDGIIVTAVGNGISGFGGDGGAATSASLSFPVGIAIDNMGNLLIGGTANFRVREVTASGVISTVAGNGAQGFSGDGAAATSARLNVPYDVAAADQGPFYIADVFNQRVRQVGLETPGQTVTILASTIQALDTSKQVTTSLFAPLKNVIKVLTDGNPGNDEAGCGKLGEFISNVEAKVASGKLQESSGIELILQAQAISSDIGCP